MLQCMILSASNYRISSNRLCTLLLFSGTALGSKLFEAQVKQGCTLFISPIDRCVITSNMRTEVSSSSAGAPHDAEVASLLFVVISEKIKFADVWHKNRT